MKITLTPDIESALMEEARRQGTTLEVEDEGSVLIEALSSETPPTD